MTVSNICDDSLTDSSDDQELPKEQQQVCHFVEHHHPAESHSYTHGKDRSALNGCLSETPSEAAALTVLRFSWEAWRHF